jgi:hypothetical protein
VFSKSALADWDEVPGASDDEKIDHLIFVANQQANYLIVPDAATAKYLQKNIGHNVINRFIKPLRQRLQSEVWKKVSSPIQVSEHETVEIYRRQ